MTNLLCLQEPPQQSRCGVAVCMGRSPMNFVEKVRELLEFTTKYYQKVTILVCDEINQFEQYIGSKMSSGRAYRLAMQAGDAAIAVIEEALSQFDERDRVEIIRWKDIRDEKYESLLEVLKMNQHQLQGDLNKSSAFYIQRRLPGVEINQAKCDKFTEYTMHELPVQLRGFRYKGEDFKTIWHPVFVKQADDAHNYFSPISNITQDIRNREDIMDQVRDVDQSEEAQVIRLYWEVTA